MSVLFISLFVLALVVLFYCVIVLYIQFVLELNSINKFKKNNNKKKKKKKICTICNGVADALEHATPPPCVITSNLVDLHQRV